MSAVAADLRCPSDYMAVKLKKNMREKKEKVQNQEVESE
jgi:hypothetical protein